jgi:modulator of FtsH protease
MTDMAGWGTFFAAQVSASATLTGLLFVGLSLNLSKILANWGLPNRALAGFYLFLAILIVSSLMLLPNQAPTLIGAEVLAVGLTLWVGVTRLAVISLRQSPSELRHYFIRHFFAFQVAVIPYLAGGVMLLVGAHSGLYWVAAGIILSLFTAAMEAWVLLVEINR